MPRPFAIAAIVLATLPAAASAQQTQGPDTPNPTLQSLANDIWTDPATGCSYIRVQVPGWPARWHLIWNGTVIGLTDSHVGCAGSLPSAG
jgi:hypothetical protein